jgi:hypothetical protein
MERRGGSKLLVVSTKFISPNSIRYKIVLTLIPYSHSVGMGLNALILDFNWKCIKAIVKNG